MKTKIFNAWTPLVEKFLQDISDAKVSYAELSNWMDAEGAKVFQSSQAEYFAQNKDNYLQSANLYPPPVLMNLAYEQIAFGFDKIFAELIEKFPHLQKTKIEAIYAMLRNECLGEKFLPFIAARATITGLILKADEPNRIKNLESTIAAFEFLESASRASVESMKEWLPKIEVSMFRGPASPLLHKAKVSTCDSMDHQIEEPKPQNNFAK